MNPGGNGRSALAGAGGKAKDLMRKELHQHPTADTTTPQDETGKAAAVRAYALGWISPEACDALFALHPNWKSS